MGGIESATLGWIGIGLTIISTFVSLRKQKKLQNKKASYTYGEGALTTQVSNTSPVPIAYGKVKTAGNMIYSRLSQDKKVIYKVIALADGKINKISELKFDDIDADSSKLDSVSYNYYYGDGVQRIDDRVLGSSQELKAEAVGGLRHLAYVALQVKANDNLSGSFNTTCVLEGSIVKKYNNANDLEDYVEEWSDNPAWCVLDFMTRFNGCGMELEEIDVQSFIDGAKFFEEKNYTLNLLLDEQRSRLEWIQYMLNCCRSLLVYRAGKYSLFVEKADEVVQTYSPDDIHDLMVWFSPLQEVPDIYRVVYIDPDNEWVKINAEASLSPESYLRHQPLVETLELLGVTNFDQASRLSWFYLNQALTCQTYIEFQTDRRALNRTVGDVIEVTDYITEFQNKKFRIIKIEDTQEGSIKLTCREYNENLYTEQRGATSPVINITTLADPTEAPPEVVYVTSEQDYYLLADKTPVSNIMIRVSYADFTYTKGFNVWYQKVGTTQWVDAGFYEEGVYNFLVSGMEVHEKYIFRFQNVSRYGKVSDYSYSPEIYIEGKNLPPMMPENFRGVEVIGGFDLFWDKGEDDVDHYELYEGTVDPDALVANVYGNTYKYSALVGNYVFYLVAVDTMGNRSALAVLEMAIDRPVDVSGFDCTQNERNIEFYWNKVEDATYYVIKEGESWEYGKVLCTTAGQFFSYPYAQATCTNFWIKAYTDYGVSSMNPAFCSLKIASIPNRNMIYLYNAVQDGWSGNKYNTHVNALGLQLDAGKVYGDYIYEIQLDQEYCARNWVESIVKPVDEELELQWKDAHFTWGSEHAKRRMWFPLGHEDIFNSWTEISNYDEASMDDVSERMSLNSTMLSQNNRSPIEGSGNPTFSDLRFGKGLYLDGSCRPKWEEIDIESDFSISFTLSTPNDSTHDYDILTLRNESDYLYLHYRAVDDRFVVTLSTGEEIALDDFSAVDDFLYFTISQGEGYLTFILYSLAFDLYRVNRIKYTTEKTYTQLALYKDLEG